MDMAEVLFRAKLTRDGASTPWGFRLQGGVEFDKPLTLLKVVDESVAAKGGLHPGDIVVKLAGKSGSEMTHKDAQDAIISAGNNLEIIVERADVTIAAPTPTTTVCDVSQTTSTSSSVTSASESDDMVTTKQVPPATTETKPLATENSSEQNLSMSDNSEHSISEPDKERSVKSDNYNESCDTVNGNSAISPSETTPSTTCAETSEKSIVNTDNSQSKNNTCISKALENDKISKESSHIIEDKPSKLQPQENESSVDSTIQSSSKHKPVDNVKTQEKSVKDKSDIVTEESDPETILVSVPVPVCDTNNSQQTSDILPESAVVQNDVKQDVTKETVLNQAEHVDKEALSAHSGHTLDSKSKLETDLNLNSINLSSVTESERKKVNNERNIQPCEVESKLTTNNSPQSPKKNHASVDVSISLLQQNANSKLPSDPIRAGSPTTDPSLICKPSVIKEFQSPDVAVAQTETTATTKMAPSSLQNMDRTPTQSTPTADLSQVQSQSSHIPISSSPDTSKMSQTSSPPSSQKPLPTVSEDLAMVTIEESQATETKLVPCQQVTITPVSSVASQTTNTRTDEMSQESKVTISKAEPDVSLSGVSVPIQTPKQSQEGVSRQTNAPAEEIMIAPKPSVQIMTAAEHKESIYLPAGDMIMEELSDSESGSSGKDMSGSGVSHEMKDFSKTAPWRMHKQSGSPSTELGSSPTTTEQIVLHPWRKSRSEHPMSHSLDDRQLSAAADRMNEVAASINKPSQSIIYGESSATITISTSANEITSHAVRAEVAPMPKPQSTLTYVGKRIESPVSSPVGAGSPFFKVSSATSVPAGIKVRQPSPTNPMAYQRSTSPQGVPQYGPVQSGHPPSLQSTSRQLGMSGVHYQPSTGPHGGTAHQPSSPRAVSPVSFQHHARLQTGPSLGYPRSVSPQGNASLMVPQTGPYPQSPSPVSPTPQVRMTIRAPPPQQHVLQAPGFPVQQPQYQQPSPRLSQPRILQPPRGLGQPVPRGSLQRMPHPGQFTRDVDISGLPRGPSGAVARPPISTPASVPGAPTSGPGSAGLFALFDKRFTEKFLQWSDERPGDLCRSETYKLVHEMDEESDDL